MSVINLGRTTKTNIVFYQTDGMGRDGYITYNNGGFWKNRHIKAKDTYIPHKKITVFHSLFHKPAPFTYISDGSGRDSYVIEHNGGLVKNFEPLIEQKLPKFLRKNDDDSLFRHKLFLTKMQKQYLNKIRRIQDNVVHRLYKDTSQNIKKNNLKHRNKSFNDLLINKEKINSLTGIMTHMPAIENNRSLAFSHLRQIEKPNLENQSDSSLNNLSPKNNIVKKMINNRIMIKGNSSQNLGKFNSRNNFINRNIKVLKKMKINSSQIMNQTNDDIIKDNNKMKYCNNSCSNYQIKPINKFRALRIKNGILRNENFSMNDINKYNDYRYEY